jgi:hypothetical protein
MCPEQRNGDVGGDIENKTKHGAVATFTHRRQNRLRTER